MANKYQCRSCGRYFFRDRSGEPCPACGHLRSRWANGDKVTFAQKQCVVCCKTFTPKRADQTTCLDEYCQQENQRRKQRVRNKKYNGIRAQNYAVDKLRIVSTCHNIIPTDPWNSDNTDGWTGLPVTHAWHCIEPHP